MRLLGRTVAAVVLASIGGALALFLQSKGMIPHPSQILSQGEGDPPVAVSDDPAADDRVVGRPIPEPIVKKGLAVEVKDFVRLPDTRASDSHIAWARPSYIRDSPDGRRFANDSRGFLYLIDADNQPHLYADLAAAFPYCDYDGLESGFIGFAFHPEFAKNGLFYTSHVEYAQGNPKRPQYAQANPKKPDFIPIGYGLKDATYYSVITEWHATNPAANTFEGTRREILRAAHVVRNLIHPISAVEFNSAAKPGDPDYGLLYTGGTEFGFANGGGPNASNPAQAQRLDSIVGAILRIDPQSPSVTHGQKGLGDYTIPMANKFAADGDPQTLGEIYAYGFRNAHRFSWDTDGTMFASDIGMNNIEEINIVHNGANYGWMKREGYFENGVVRGRPLNTLYPLPPEILDGRVKDGLTYPVAVYDHKEGQSVTDGFAYHGRISALNGKFIFGDIKTGRVFACDLAALKKADDGIPRTVAPIEEVQLYVRDSGGKRVDVSFLDLIDKTTGLKRDRADLHIGRSRDGELFLTSRQDGMIRMLVPDSGENESAKR
jgi:Glucose / Sorbosone dehydrogenase